MQAHQSEFQQLVLVAEREAMRLIPADDSSRGRAVAAPSRSLLSWLQEAEAGRFETLDEWTELLIAGQQIVGE